MEFCLLGPLAVRSCGAVVPVPRGRQRAVLAALLLNANRVVPVGDLARALWGPEPPPSARASVQNHVMKLRKALGDGQGRLISTHPGGYVIGVDRSQVDVACFETLAGAARSAARDGNWDRASARAGQALALWRGEPLADVESEVLAAREVPRLSELRLQVLEERISADLHLGRNRAVIGELRQLVATHPLRERLSCLVMIALYRDGRQAEALAAYQHARQVLVNELGAEPGTALRDLHQQILTADPALGQPAPAWACGGPPAPTASRPTWPEMAGRQRAVPRELPPTVPAFTGRAAELKTLTGILDLAGPGAPGTAVISVIGGMPGVGKTALAVHWAHMHCGRFPDGQLYVNLRGYDPGGTPMPAAEAVRQFLAALDVPAQRIPAGPNEQTALYRTLLAGRRMLIVLDNARDTEQVRPLLPGAPGCLVLVTSRNQLAALIALHGAVPLTLDLLTPDEARELLARRLGRERVAAECQAAGELIEACARLPLALNIAAARAALYPGHLLSGLAGALRDARCRLDALDTQDGAADLRAVFSWSYRTLPPETARVFRLLGLHPGPDISQGAAASLTALDPDRARRALDALTAAHLISEHAPGRYAFHDLLRAYAAEQSHIHDSQAGQQDALRRVCDYYLHTARTADRLLHPHRPLLQLGPPARGTRHQHLNDMAMALDWFATEHSNLLTAQRTAATHSWHATVWQLAWTLSTFHIRRGHRHHELATWTHALKTAACHLDPAARILIHRFLGRACADLSCHDEAIEHLHQALTEAEHHHDLTEQAHIHRTLAWAWERAGNLQQELHHATRSLDLYRAVNRSEWEADALHMVGWCIARLGSYDPARARCQTALALHRQHHYATGEADTLHTLGYIEHHTGHHQQAIDHYQQALALRRAIGNTSQSADTLDQLGHPHAALGQHHLARTAWQQALRLYQQHGRAEDAQRVQRQLGTLNHPDSRQPSAAP